MIDCKGKPLDLSRPQVMGVLNITPDSFSDGGDFFAPEKAVQHALQMEAEGAAIVDIGGESSRPGAQPVPEADEIRRVVPVIEALQSRLRVPISIDTQKPGVSVPADRGRRARYQPDTLEQLERLVIPRVVQCHPARPAARP